MSIYIGDQLVETIQGTLERENAVAIPIFHTGIFARSGMGKTTLIKSMIQQAVEQGFRVLIFDSKITEPEFEGMGTTIPFYLQENTDPDVYRSLIEGVRTTGHGDMKRYRGAFIKLCEAPGEPKARDYVQIEQRLREKVNTAKGYYADMYNEIYHDHLKLEEMLRTTKFSNDGVLKTYLTSGDRIRRMAVRELPNLNLQGLVVRSVVEWLLRSGISKLIIVVDEAPNFVNQSLYNPAKSALAQLDAQGRSKQIFGWYTGQTLTGFDKRNMKNLQEWILGGEMERNEVKAVYQTQTDKVLTQDEIKKLKVREFIVSTPDWSKLVKVPDLRSTAAVRMEWADKAINQDQEDFAAIIKKEILDPEIKKAGLDPKKVNAKLVFGEADTRVGAPSEGGDVAALQGVGSNPTPPHFTMADLNKAVDDVQKAFPDAGTIELTKQERKDLIKPPPHLQTKTIEGKLRFSSSGVEVLPETKPITTFTLQVTRLTSDNLYSKLMLLIKRHGALRQVEMIVKGVEYGWVLEKPSVSKGVNELVGKGILVGPDTNKRYRFPKDDSFKVEEK